MIYFELNELHKDNIYRKTQSMIEYLCDKYAFSEQMGVIETANHSIIEHLLSLPSDFSLDVNAHVENNTLVFNYLSSDPIFRFLDDLETELDPSNIWCVLIDDFSVSDDYKSLTINFYVKPHQVVSRSAHQTVLQTKESYLP